MKYCYKLFYEINFEPACLSPCCNTQNIAVPEFAYAGGPIDLQAYAGHIQKTFDEIQRDGKVCKGCSDLGEIGEFPGMSGKFNAVSLNMHRHFCNCKCSYCDLWQVRQPNMGYDPLPGLISLHGQGAMDKHCLIAWGGGEPSILPTFEAASSWATRNGYYQRIHTNALKFSESIANMLEGGTGEINISLDSGSPETYQRVKGVNGFERVYANLKEYARRNSKKIALKYIIYERNNTIRDVERFLGIASSLGIKNIEFSFNFKELQKNSISAATLQASAFLLGAAKARHFNLAPFAIPQKWMDRLDEFIGQTYGATNNAAKFEGGHAN